MIAKKERMGILFTRGISRVNKKFLETTAKKTERTIGDVLNLLLDKQRGRNDRSRSKLRSGIKERNQYLC